MKKIVLAISLLVTVVGLNAQVTVYRATNMPMTTTSFPGTSVPTYIVSSFEQAYPGATVLTWEPVRNYWRASYNLDNRMMYVFYDERGVNYRAALPMLQNNVPEDVVTTALKVHGPIVYGITKVKAAGDKEVYKIRLLDNGTTKLVWMNADGTVPTDVFRVTTEEKAMTPVPQQ